MLKRFCTVALMGSFVLLGACSEEQPPQPSPTVQPTTTPTDNDKSVLDRAKDSVKDTTQKTQDALNGAGDKAKDMAQDANNKLMDTKDNAMKSMDDKLGTNLSGEKAMDNAGDMTAPAYDVAGAPAQNVSDSAAGASGAASVAQIAEAKGLVEQAMTYINENKYDLADKTLTQVEGMKGLPTSVTSTVQQARTLLTTKQASDTVGNLNVPDFK